MAGPLRNARHERFAQELAKGKSQLDAYKAAGYRPDRGAATRLSANVSVQERLAELKEKSAERTVITVENLTARLLAIAAKGEDKTDAPLLSVARASLMDAAKLNGLIIDRSKVDFDLSGLTEEELEQLERLHARITKP
jgi:terminase small subunit-like protein